MTAVEANVFSTSTNPIHITEEVTNSLAKAKNQSKSGLYEKRLASSTVLTISPEPYIRLARNGTPNSKPHTLNPFEGDDEGVDNSPTISPPPKIRSSKHETPKILSKSYPSNPFEGDDDGSDNELRLMESITLPISSNPFDCDDVKYASKSIEVTSVNPFDFEDDKNLSEIHEDIIHTPKLMLPPRPTKPSKQPLKPPKPQKLLNSVQTFSAEPTTTSAVSIGNIKR